MKRTLTYAAALLAGCVLALGPVKDDLWRSATPAKPIEQPAQPVEVQPAAAPAATDPLVARLDALQSTLTDVQGRVQALERAPVGGIAERHAALLDVAPDEALHAGEQSVPLDQEEDPDARYQQMQELLARQTPDPGWEVIAASEIAAQFEAGAPAGMVIENIACVGRMCRLDLHHEAGAALDDLLLSDAVAPWPHRGVVHAVDAERSVLFLVSEEP